MPINAGTYSSKFYYLTSQDTQHYTYTPTGQLSIERLVEGRPAWIFPILPKITKPKKLVLANIFNSINNQLTLILTKLLDDGFDLYYWKDDSISRFSRDDLKDNLHASLPASGATIGPVEEIINHMVCQHNTPIEQILLLDNHLLECIANNDSQMPRKLKVSDYGGLSFDQRNIVMQNLSNCSPTVSIIENDSPLKYGMLVAQLRQYFSKADYIKNYFILEVADEINQLNTKDVVENQAEILKLDECDKLTILRLESKITSTSLSKLLNAAVSAKELIIKNSANLHGLLTLNDGSLTKMMKVLIHNANINSKSLVALLTRSLNLEVLELKNCNNLDASMIFLKELRLEKLKEIDLSFTRISVESLELLLSNSPNLEKISLAGYQNLSGAGSFPIETVYGLREVPPSRSDKLLLSNKTRLEKLKEINLSGSNITLRWLASLLSNTPNLEKIDLSFSDILISDSLLLRSLSLKKLTEINLSHCNNTASSLELILYNAPNLETINLTDCIHLNVELGLFNISRLRSTIKLEKLKTLNLSNSDITDELLELIAFKALNIEKIYLSGCNKITNKWPILNKFSIETLKEIYVDEIAISEEALAIFLSKAKKLRFISLENAHINASDCSMQLPDLSKLSIEINPDCIIRGQFAEQLKDKGGSIISGDSKEQPSTYAQPFRPIQQKNITILKDPQHDPKNYLNKVPPADGDSFKFQGTNKSKNQKMIMEKLCQYLTLQQKHLLEIPKIQRGICFALSRFYIDNHIDNEANKCSLFINQAHDWDGTEDNLTTELKNLFDNFYSYVNEYQLRVTCSKSSYYIGDALCQYILNTNDTGILFMNPWHAIAAIPNADGKDGWILYDPNYVDGPKTIRKENLHIAIHDALGKLIRIGSATTITIKPSILEPLSFIENGGLLALLYANHDDRTAMLESLHSLNDYSPESLQGLLLKSNQYNPAWFIGIECPDQRVSQYTEMLLKQFLKKVPDALNLLHHSGEGLPTIKKQRLIECLKQLAPLKKEATGKCDLKEITVNKPLSMSNQSTSKRLSTMEQKRSVECVSQLAPPKVEVNGKCDLKEIIVNKSLPMSNQPTTERLQTMEQNRSVGCVSQCASPKEEVNGKNDLKEITVNKPLPMSNQSTVVTTFLQQLQQRSENKAKYIQLLSTWKKQTATTSNLIEYIKQSLVKGDIKKRLIEVSSETSANAVLLSLERVCKDTRRPVFYVDKPEDLITTAAYIKHHEDGSGSMVNGPGGRLYNFLTQQVSGQFPVLIINYNNFDADDIVQFNGLLDKSPKADGTPLPQNTVVIGVINTSKPDFYQGGDFYSRFDEADAWLLNKQDLDDSLIQLPETKQFNETNLTSLPERYVIDLHHSPTWRNQLLGCWQINGRRLYFEKGELENAIASRKTIELRNAPIHDKEFERFYRRCILNKSIEHGIKIIDVPDDTQFIFTTGYDWDYLKQAVLDISEQAPEDTVFVLNSYTLNHFLGHYVLNDDGLSKNQGFIAQMQDQQNIYVDVTNSLTDDNWAILLERCHSCNVKLKLRIRPNVQLPIQIAHNKLTYQEQIKTAWTEPSNANTQWITSTDIDTTVCLLTQYNDDYVVIDISECDASDLLSRIEGQFNKDSLTFDFIEKQCALLKLLNENKKVILTGQFAHSLIDSLAPLLLKRLNSVSSQGTLILVGAKDEDISYLPIQEHTVTCEQKLSCLGSLSSRLRKSLDPYIKSESLAQLRSRRDYLLTHPDAHNSNDAWVGLQQLQSSDSEIEELDVGQSEIKATLFTKNRLAEVNRILASSPVIFLSGLSGVGKTMFVEKELCHHDAQLFMTENSMEQWAQDNRPGRKILFLDEANLTSRKWSEFEGLFQIRPGILINGQFYKLTKEHKVIFAGNPIYYGNERRFIPFFKRHGYSVLFKPLSAEVIYEKILKPVFIDTPTPLLTSQVKISSYLLEIYRFICSLSQSEVLISPRELQMMALQIVSYYKRHPTQNIDTITSKCCYQLATNLIAEEHQAEFNRRFKPIPSLTPNTDLPEADDDFFPTRSRQDLKFLLDNLLSIKEDRYDNPSMNEAKKYGGLGGVLIEGMPGIGKSEQVILTLVKHGYHESYNYTNADNNLLKKRFYKMPISMPLQEKNELILKAFDEGAILLIDEINSSSMMERLLNDLLMGKKPGGGQPQHPGFMVIGTQNPITMAGRKAMSPALSRRLTKVILPEYALDELFIILIAKGVPLDQAELLVEVYDERCHYAKNNQLHPAPNFRNLLSVAGVSNKKTDMKNILNAIDHITNNPIQNRVAAEFMTCSGIMNDPRIIIQLKPEYNDLKNEFDDNLKCLQLEHKIGEQDIELEKYLKEMKSQWANTETIESLTALNEKLKNTRARLSEQTSYYQGIRNAVKSYTERSQSNCICSSEKLYQRGKTLEQALKSVSMNDRSNLSEDSSGTEARNVVNLWKLKNGTEERNTFKRWKIMIEGIKNGQTENQDGITGRYERLTITGTMP